MADFTAIDLFGEIYDADDANAVQQSQVVPTVDADSDDDHIPTAKAVFDAIVAAPSDFYDNKVVAFPENTTAITITPDSIVLTADESVTIIPDKPYTKVTFTDWGNLNGADITNFTYIGQPADFSSIADMVIEFLPNKTILGFKCLIEASGGDNHYAYYFYRVLEHETAEAYAGMDNLLFAPEWDMLSLYPKINASNEIEGFVINGGAYPVKDPNAADQTLSNLSDAVTARTNLGLGTGATATVASGYTASDGNSSLATIGSVRKSNTYNTEQIITTQSNSITGATLYRRVIRESGLSVAANTVYTFTTQQNFTDVVAIDAYGKDASGSFYTLSANCYNGVYLTAKNTSNVTITEITIVMIYSKS